ERGYFVRRLIRRAVHHADIVGLLPGLFSRMAEPVVAIYDHAYPELLEQKKNIMESIEKEEEKFRVALGKGRLVSLDQTSFTAKNAFNLYQSHGLPKDVIKDLAKERGFAFDEQGFDEEFKKHQEVSRTSAAGKFKGGLADTKEETVRLHTAHHLLLAALRQVLGDHVHQRGSNITAERARIDFSHPQKVLPEQLKQIEDLVNEKIKGGLEMVRKEMPKEEALKLGAEMEFGVKYGDIVSVYIAEDAKGNIFSKEFCGGPHVKNTKELGAFKIQKEEAVSAGVRRIRAVLTP
ncbi:MAG: alanine--tRNA ligase-related protein, partial [bacterium]|nr:alanine--tRNA ligase-related protein [bacterium]